MCGPGLARHGAGGVLSTLARPAEYGVVPGPVVIEVVRQAPAPGVGESDFIRWVGVAVAVAGAFLATPEGIASV